MTKVKTFATAGILIVVAALGYQFINPGGAGPLAERNCKPERGEPVTGTIAFAPDPMPKQHPVIIDFYVTGGTGPAPQCHLERGTSGFSLTLHLQRGQVAHLGAKQNDQTTTMLQCWLHHRGKAVAHDLKPRGTVSCEYMVP